MPSSGDLVGPLAGLLASKNKGNRNKILFKVFESLVCSICQEYMYVPMMIQCGHNFCYSCLLAWFNSDSEEELSCPHCRGSVINMPCLNSTLQQWLRSVIELLESETGNEVEKSTLARIIDAKRSSEDEYKEHVNRHDLFRGVFKNSAVGVQDEDDDGILRCSNCLWELEDDEDGSCPHCNMRIRSRARRAGSQSENEEADTALSEDDEIFLSEQEARTADTELCLLYAKHDYTYAARLDSFLQASSDTSMILEGQSDPDFPVKFRSVRLGSCVVHYPSYSLYASIVLDTPEADKERALQMINDVEYYGPNNLLAEFDDYVAQRFEAFRDMTSGSSLTKEQFEHELRLYASSASSYESLVCHEAALPAEERPLHVLGFDTPFIAQFWTDTGDRIVFPAFSVFITADKSPTLREEKRMIHSYVRRMEDFCHKGYSFTEFQRRILDNGTERSEEDDDSLRDFIASEDDDDVDMVELTRAGNVVDLEAEQSDHSSLQSGDYSTGSSDKGSSAEEPDSDFYERNEGDGYVSGDSLNDEDHTTRIRSQDEQDEDRYDEDDDDEDDDDEPSRIPMPRKRNRAVVEVSDEDDDDSSDD